MAGNRSTRFWAALGVLALLAGVLVTAASPSGPASAAPSDRWIEVQPSCCGDGSSHVAMAGAWADGQPVTLEVDRLSTGPGIDPGDTQNGTTPTGFFITSKLVPGDRVVVTSDGVTKELVVEDLFVEYTNSATDVVAGRAPAGRTVEVTADPDATAPTLPAIADGTGHWSVDFTNTFDIDEHDPSGPATSSQLVSARLAETGVGADGDSTIDGRPVDRAFISVLPNCCGNQAIIQNPSQGWRVGTVLHVEVDRGNDNSSEYDDTLTYSGGAQLTPNNALTPLAAGDLVRVSGAGWVRELVVVAPFSIDTLQTSTDVVSGSAPPGETVTVSISTPNVSGPPHATLTAVADNTTGLWTVDFTDTYDIPPGDQASATIADTDGDTQGALWFPTVVGPYLDITPNTGLTDLQVVNLSGANWPQAPGGRVLHVTECALQYGLSVESCDAATSQQYTLNPDGTLPDSAPFTVHATITIAIPGPGSSYDCVSKGCGLVGVVWPGDVPNSGFPEALDFPQNNVLWPAPPPLVPQVTVTPPPGGAGDGDGVTVDLVDFPANQQVQIRQCGPPAPAPSNPFGINFVRTCQNGLPVDQPPPSTNGDGALTVQFQVSRYLIGSGDVTVTPNAALLDGQTVTVSGSGFTVADCATEACTIEAVVQGYFGGPIHGSDDVAVNTDATPPQILVRENFVGQNPGIVIFPYMTGGAIPATLADGDHNGSFDFTTPYTVHRLLTTDPEVATSDPAPPVGGYFGFLTNPIDCLTLADDLVAHGVDPRPDPSNCLIDVRPPRTTLGTSDLQFTIRLGDTALVEAGMPYPPSHDTYLEFTSIPPWPKTGFFKPVDNPPKVNDQKAGSAVPVKFGLGGDRGLDVFADGYPQSAEYACNADPVPDLTTGEPTDFKGKHELKYDKRGDRYEYKWKTEKAWKGTCRQLILKFDDGTYMRANFKFK